MKAIATEGVIFLACLLRRFTMKKGRKRGWGTLAYGQFPRCSGCFGSSMFLLERVDGLLELNVVLGSKLFGLD